MPDRPTVGRVEAEIGVETVHQIVHERHVVDIASVAALGAGGPAACVVGCTTAGTATVAA